MEKGYELVQNISILVSVPSASGHSTHTVQMLLLRLHDFNSLEMTTLDNSFGLEHCKLLGGPHLAT